LWEFEGSNGPFAGFLKYLKIQNWRYDGGQYRDLEDHKRIDIFPEVFGDPKVGTVHTDRKVEFDPQTVSMLVDGTDRNSRFYDVDGKYDFLQQRDVVSIDHSDRGKVSKHYMQITHKRRMTFSELLLEVGDHPFMKDEMKDLVERRVGRQVKPDESVTIYEFKKTYEWKLKGS
jgi:hypothetical protein